MSDKYWEVYPHANISRLKIKLDALIKNEIEKNSNISFDDIFSWLIERGFMPLNIYAFLTGFLLIPIQRGYRRQFRRRDERSEVGGVH